MPQHRRLCLKPGSLARAALAGQTQRISSMKGAGHHLTSITESELMLEGAGCQPTIPSSCHGLIWAKMSLLIDEYSGCEWGGL
jgi:hypothetical protein